MSQRLPLSSFNWDPSFLLGASGPIAKNLPGYQARQPQIILAEHIREAFSTEQDLIAEASTGTGKSFACLVAAFETATVTKTPVVISTHTIALQEQLCDKDVPFLLSKLGVAVKVVLAKGRGNYVSIRRAQIVIDEGQPDSVILEKWLPKTKDGTRESLPGKIDPFVWSRARSDTDQCLGEGCSTYDTCFYQRARRDLLDAEVIITNHNLVLLDRKMKTIGMKGVLPDYQYLILDEAHEFENVARQVLTFEVKSRDIPNIFYELYNDKLTGVINKLLPGVQQTLREQHTTTTVDPRATIIKQTADSISKLLESNDDLFRKVDHYLAGDLNKRFTEKHAIKTDIYQAIQDVMANLKEINKYFDDKNHKAAVDYVMKRCTEIAMGVDDILELPNVEGKDYPSVVAWAYTGQGQNKIKFHGLVSAPIFLKPLLKKMFFDSLKSVVLTSATLATGGNDPFKMVESSLGMDKPMKLKLPPVFDYKKQACIIVVEDMPLQGAPDYIDVMAEQVKKYVKATKGGAFVLFTAFSVMNQVYEKTKVSFETMGYTVLCQGKTLNRTQMISEFKKLKHGVLFGVSSFWTGVDIPGYALRNLIITKLPFPTPDDPLMQAQEEIYKKFNRNFFIERAVPMTAVMLKQGFGRLIRTNTDKGIVVILDSRVVTKRYGQILLGALPSDCPLKKTHRNTIVGN